jgi:hypothetical protein
MYTALSLKRCLFSSELSSPSFCPAFNKASRPGSFFSGETSGTPGTRERVAEVNQIRQQSDPGAL